MRTIDTISEFAETGHRVHGHWTCRHSAEIDLGRFLFAGLGDLPMETIRALRCPTCGQGGPAEIRIQGPISDQVRSRKQRDAEERKSKVVRFKPKS